MTRFEFQLKGLKRLLQVAAAGLFISAAGAADNSSPPVSSAPKAASVVKPVAEPADNSFCYVCHRNLEKEPLNVIHTKQGVGCEKCHGMSEKHSADEDGVTPPEILYSKARINAFCIKCHAVEVLQKSPKHQSILALIKENTKPIKSAKEEIKSPNVESAKSVCTDCHGQHRLKVRTRTWDKETGKLIKDDGVRMMDKNRPEK